MNNLNKFIKVFLIYLMVAVVIALPFALLGGFWPKNIIGWIILVLAGFPLLVLGDYLGEKLFSKKISRSLEQSHKEKFVSLRRILYALAVGIIIVTVITLLVYFFRENIGNYFIIV